MRAMSTPTLTPQNDTGSKRHARGRIWTALAASVVAMGLLAWYITIRPESTVVRDEPYEVGTTTSDQLARLADLRIFFGHQSVGQNIIDAIPSIYAAARVDAPTIVESATPLPMPGGYIQHAHIGTNGDPIGKIAEFDRIMRSGVADNVDVAAMKLCYIDLEGKVDVEAVFTSYRDTLTALERDYPNVTFIYLTAPLTTERDWVKRLKARLGVSDYYPPSDNVIREEFNEKIRSEYAPTGRLFDIAAVQSTVDGTRALRNYDDADYYSMEESLSSDLGHLNTDGAAIVGSAFLASIAQADPAGGK